MTYVNGFGDCEQDWKNFEAAKVAYPGLVTQYNADRSAFEKTSAEWKIAATNYQNALAAYKQNKATCDSMFTDWNTKVKAYQAGLLAYNTAKAARLTAIAKADADYAAKKAKYDADLKAYNTSAAQWQAYNGTVNGMQSSLAQQWYTTTQTYPTLKTFDFSQYYLDCGQGVKFGPPAVTKATHDTYAKNCVVIRGLGATTSDPCWLKLLPVASCPTRPSPLPPKPVEPAPASSFYPPEVPPFTLEDPTNQKPVCTVAPMTVADPGKEPTFSMVAPVAPVAPTCDRSGATPTSTKAGLGNIWIWLAIAGGAGYVAYKKWG